MDNLTVTPTTTEDRIRDTVEAVLGEGEVYIVDIVIRGRQGSRVVEVFLDADEGIGVGLLARLGREIGFALEAEDIVKGHYRLDVSSPGADRPLVLPRQYKKHIGRTLAIVSVEGEDATTGVLKAIETKGITLKAGGTEIHVPYSEIKEAKVVLPW